MTEDLLVPWGNQERQALVAYLRDHPDYMVGEGGNLAFRSDKGDLEIMFALDKVTVTWFNVLI